ncbi:hypothetical protein PF010_g17251 [Phytophthora fragariae]|uniref:RxLR effector protein n=1 Tax=Phytophthora fragariae TaxID=53985 RepID=A0A6A3E8S6_9STRA|nr:hypothetical protein PF009_g19964 [Phytophthora fragariae]KAE9094051.1 hypothetical protein PF010_g17251 [Phytophthora fragariae]
MSIHCLLCWNILAVALPCIVSGSRNVQLSIRPAYRRLLSNSTPNSACCQRSTLVTFDSRRGSIIK